MNKKILLAVTILICLSFLVFMPALAADSVSGGVQEFGGKLFGGSPPQGSPAYYAAQVVKVLLGFVGIVFFILVVYGGFRYMTSGGNDEKVKKAKNYIIFAIIGLAIVLSAYAIANFVVTAIFNVAKMP